METNKAAEFSASQVAQARNVIDRATDALGTLSIGQATDLLLDNLDWLEDVAHAKFLLLASSR
jgi:hypothetical protein